LTERSGNNVFRKEGDFVSLDPDVKANIPEDVYNPGDTSHPGGWYIPLHEDAANNFAEYVSAKPVIINGTLYVSTFIQQNKAAADDSSICVTERSADGNSRLFAVDVATGAANTWDPDPQIGNKRPKYIELEGVKIVSMTNMMKGGKNRLLINLDILNEYRYSHSAKGGIKTQSNARGVKTRGENGGDDGEHLDPEKYTLTYSSPAAINLDPNANVTQYWLKY
jgi:hypothetical protein